MNIVRMALDELIGQVETPEVKLITWDVGTERPPNMAAQFFATSGGCRKDEIGI
jgi:hypothetical protein